MSLQNDGGAKTRAKEKERLVLSWLYQWGFSTRRLLSQLLGVSVAGQGAFYSRLLAAGVITEQPLPLSQNEKLIGLSKSGAGLAASYGVLGRYKRNPPTLGMLAHELTLQRAVISRLDDASSATPEWMNASGGKGKNCDAIIQYPNYAIALEVELSHKNNVRIYYNYLSHLRNIRAGLYKKVVYVFTDETLRSLYERKFRAAEWPVVVSDDRHRLKVRPDTFRLGEENWPLIEFVLGEEY